MKTTRLTRSAMSPKMILLSTPRRSENASARAGSANGGGGPRLGYLHERCRQHEGGTATTKRTDVYTTLGHEYRMLRAPTPDRPGSGKVSGGIPAAGVLRPHRGGRRGRHALAAAGGPVPRRRRADRALPGRWLKWHHAYQSQRRGDEPRGVAQLIGDSPPMWDLTEKIPRVVGAPFPVVIEGESGTGKNLIARAIHEEGRRRAAAFVHVNCVVLGDELFGSELFGSGTRRAPSPAPGRTLGLLELSSGGTVFLDGEAEPTPRALAKRLRIRHDGRSAGSARTAPSGSTFGSSPPQNRPLDAEAAEGRFRNDLLYRLDVVGLTAPPQRERGPNVARVAEHSHRHRTPLRPGGPRRPAGGLPDGCRRRAAADARRGARGPLHQWTSVHPPAEEHARITVGSKITPPIAKTYQFWGRRDTRTCASVHRKAGLPR